MNAYKLKVNVGNRNVELSVKSGVIASIETGSHVEQNRKPKSKVSVFVNDSESRPSAWIQISDFDQNGAMKVTHEGFVVEGDGEVVGLLSNNPIKATLSRLMDVPETVHASLKLAQFGTMDCCTSYGSNCYVTCCGGCCADPTGCPGASCCP